MSRIGHGLGNKVGERPRTSEPDAHSLTSQVIRLNGSMWEPQVGNTDLKCPPPKLCLGLVSGATVFEGAAFGGQLHH